MGLPRSTHRIAGGEEHWPQQKARVEQNRNSPPLQRIRREIHRGAERRIQTTRGSGRLAEPVPYYRFFLRGGRDSRVGEMYCQWAALPAKEACLLVRIVCHGSGGSRERV